MGLKWFRIDVRALFWVTLRVDLGCLAWQPLRALFSAPTAPTPFYILADRSSTLCSRLWLTMADEKLAQRRIVHVSFGQGHHARVDAPDRPWHQHQHLHRDTVCLDQN